MNTCIKSVVNKNCHYFLGTSIKFGKTGNPSAIDLKDAKRRN
jgi:hypothetical protein